MGITNMAATIPGFAVPAFVGVMTHGKVRVKLQNINYIMLRTTQISLRIAIISLTQSRHDNDDNSTVHLSHFQPGLGPWHVVFGVTAGLLLVEFMVYTMFASGEEQPWNKDKEEEDSVSNHEAIELNKDNDMKA